MTMKTFSIVAALLLICMITPCLAEMNDSDQADSLFTPVSIQATGGVIADADFKSSGGSAQVLTNRLRLRAGAFSFSYAGRNYSWDDVGQLNFGNGSDKPWDTLHRLRLSFGHEGEINENWFYSTEIVGTSSFEKEMEGSYGAALRGGFGYLINENWGMEFGAQVFTNNINSSILPYLGIGYENFDSDGAGYFMTLGAPSTEAGYAFSEETRVRFAFDMTGTTYRLKDNSSVSRKGYMETSSMVTGLYCDWKPTDAFSLSLGPEYHFERNMKLYDQKGKKLGSKIKQKSAFGGLLQLGYKF